jgi:hypothetical protein
MKHEALRYGERPPLAYGRGIERVMRLGLLITYGSCHKRLIAHL